MLLDSNLIIYAAQPEHAFLCDLLERDDSVVSGISLPEVLGYTLLTARQRSFYDTFFSSTPMLPVDELVLRRAAELRQGRKFKLGDSIVAATALLHGLTLATRDIEDFQCIPRLSLNNPFEHRPDSTKEGGSL